MNNQFIKNIIISMIITIACWLTVSQAQGTEIEVVDVKRNITLSNDAPVFKDYYINTKNSASLKKNLVVKAKRIITVKDASQKPIGDFRTTVGLLKIIHVEGTIAVAREVSLTPRTDEPMLEQIGIMVGDEIDLQGSYTQK
ncbi:MAG: hypothetical protein ACK41T_12600 [Pseudobdellovibrio sp.]